MQITHVQAATDATTAVRGGDREFKSLLVGDDNAPDNYRLLFVRQSGKVRVPRHKHNFDQIRLCLGGGAVNYGPDRWINPGELAYFPEGAEYGPEDSDNNRVGVTVQFGGASGSGFVSSRKLREGTDAMKAFGDFKDGVFTRRGDLAPGERRNQDGYEAVWEHLNRRKLEYPKPRYPEPILIKPAHFAWQEQPGQPGLAVKTLGCFTERNIEVSMLRLSAGAKARIPERAGTQLVFVISGGGQVGNGKVGEHELHQYTAFSLEAGMSADIRASSDLEMLLIGLPIF